MRRITGFEWWFNDPTGTAGIAELFKNIDFKGSNSKEKQQYAEATASYILADGTHIPVVVTCRPEARPEQAFVAQVVEHFQ